MLLHNEWHKGLPKKESVLNRLSIHLAHTNHIDDDDIAAAKIKPKPPIVTGVRKYLEEEELEKCDWIEKWWRNGKALEAAERPAAKRALELEPNAPVQQQPTKRARLDSNENLPEVLSVTLGELGGDIEFVHESEKTDWTVGDFLNGFKTSKARLMVVRNPDIFSAAVKNANKRIIETSKCTGYFYLEISNVSLHFSL